MIKLPRGTTPADLYGAIQHEWNIRARRSLAVFLRRAWPHFEANTYAHGRHIDVMAERLEAINRGESRRLLVNIPPRHTKSDLISVCWPAWTWLQDSTEMPLGGPHVQFLFGSHSWDLAVRDSRRCRALIETDWYQALCGGRVKLRQDANAAHAWELTTGGSRRSTSVESRITGFGADIQVVDDPHDVREVEGAAARESVRMFYFESLPSRMNHPKNNARVVSAQRTHLGDLSGMILEAGEPYDHVCLPGEHDPEHPHLSPHDWRQPGELLWPERFPTKAEYDGLAGTAYARAAQVDQNPTRRGIGLFRNARWEFADEAPARLRLVRWWDKAATADGSGDPDYTAGALGGMDELGIFWLLDMQHGRWSSHQVEQRIGFVARELDPRGTRIYIEEEPGSAGKDVTSYYQRRVLPGFPVRGDRPTGPKIVRCDGFIAAAEVGNVVLVRGEWNRAFLEEAEVFAGDDSTHDDQVIAAVGCHARSVSRVGAISQGRLHGV